MGSDELVCMGVAPPGLGPADSSRWLQAFFAALSRVGGSLVFLEADQPRHDLILSSPLNPDRMRWFYFPVPQLIDLQG